MIIDTPKVSSRIDFTDVNTGRLLDADELEDIREYKVGILIPMEHHPILLNTRVRYDY